MWEPLSKKPSDFARECLEEAQRAIEGAMQRLETSAILGDADFAVKEALIRYAEMLVRQRRVREQFFPTKMLGEPAWDLLLDLFIAQERGQKVPVTSACAASRAPQATALRYICALAADGMVERISSPDDRRVVYLVLTPKADGQLRSYLSSLVENDI